MLQYMNIVLIIMARPQGLNFVYVWTNDTEVVRKYSQNRLTNTIISLCKFSITI